MNPETAHVEVGAYALGLLEEPDRRAFEAHLATCAACHHELASLRGVAAALDGMPLIESLPETPATDTAIVTDLVRRRADVARHRRRGRTFLAAAAGVAIFAGGAGGGLALGAMSDDGGNGGTTRQPTTGTVAAPPNDGAQALLANGHRISATDPRSGATGVVAMEQTNWGTRIAMRLAKVRGPLECELIAVSGGQRRVVSGWSVPPKGYGLPGSPRAQLTVQGGVGVQPTDIDHFEVRTTTGRTLLKLPV